MVMTIFLRTAPPAAAQLQQQPQRLAAQQQMVIAEDFSQDQSQAEDGSSGDQDAKKNPPALH
jgi:hypothetical protein